MKKKTVYVKRSDLPSIRARAEEMESIFALFAISEELANAEKRMEKRLKAIPYGLRDIRMLKSVADKLCYKLVATLPAEKFDNVMANARHMTYDIHFNRFSGLPAPDNNYALVRGDDLDVVMKHVHDMYCFGCQKNCNSCDIGKAFDHTMVQSRRRNERWEDIDLHADHAAGEIVEDEKATPEGGSENE